MGREVERIVPTDGLAGWSEGSVRVDRNFEFTIDIHPFVEKKTLWV